MNRLFTILLGILIISSCTKKDSELIGQWKLVEILADPGDGSGTFHKVSSEKYLAFHADGTITSNGSVCHMSIESDTPSAGTYSLADSTITPSDCPELPFKIRFEKVGSSLIVSYPCIEPCRAKFRKD